MILIIFKNHNMMLKYMLLSNVLRSRLTSHDFPLIHLYKMSFPFPTSWILPFYSIKTHDVTWAFPNASYNYWAVDCESVKLSFDVKCPPDTTCRITRLPVGDELSRSRANTTSMWLWLCDCMSVLRDVASVRLSRLISDRSLSLRAISSEPPAAAHLQVMGCQ